MHAQTLAAKSDSDYNRTECYLPLYTRVHAYHFSDFFALLAIIVLVAQYSRITCSTSGFKTNDKTEK